MTSIGPSFFILGLVVASVTANETSTIGLDYEVLFRDDIAKHDDATTAVSFTAPPNETTMNTKVDSVSISMMNTTTINSTIRPSTEGDDRKTTKNIPVSSVTPEPMTPTKTAPATKAKETIKDKATTAKPQLASSDSTGIIILVVIILVALGFGVACYLARKRGRRYSVDFASRPDETNIPLSAVEPELPADTVSQNGLQTFADTPTKEPEEKPEAQEEQKAEADKSKTEADPSAESAAPAPSPATSEDKPKEDVAEQGPPAPVEEKTDDEGAASNKTSVESLKETNENNSNNADVSQQRDLVSSKLFWDVPLDSPV